VRLSLPIAAAHAQHDRLLRGGFRVVSGLNRPLGLVLIVFLGSFFFFGELWRLAKRHPRPDGKPD
jgi:hypothetical protein